MAVKRRVVSSRSTPSDPSPPPSTSTIPTSPPPPPASTHGSYLVACIVFALYGYTAYPEITGGDSGELVITACNLGIAHPPGYPLFSMLGYVAIKIIPWGSPAWRIHLLSSLYGSLASFFMYRIVIRMTYNHACAIFTSIGFALTPTVWLYSIQGEVFGLNNALVGALAYLIWCYYEREEHVDTKLSTSTSTSTSTLLSYAYLGAFVCGLAMTNQHTTVFYVIPTVLFVTYSLYQHSLITSHSITYLTISLLLGMSPYLYLIIRAYAQVMDSWGDQRTWDGFWTHFLRKEYGTFQLAASEISSNPGMISRLGVYLNVMMKESLYIMAPLAIIGIGKMLSHTRPSIRRSGLLYLISYLIYIIIFHHLANLDMRPLFLGVQARFWQQPNQYLWIWSGIGLDTCMRWMTQRRSTSTSTSTPSSSTITYFTSIFTCIYLAISLHTHFALHDHHQNDGFYQHGIHILKAFPNNSIVLLNGDLNNNVVKYPQQCHGLRHDIDLISLQLMTWEWFVPMQAHHYRAIFPNKRYHPHKRDGFSIRQFLDANLATKRPIFLCGAYKEGDDSFLNADKSRHYIEHPYGLCTQIFDRKHPPRNITRVLEKGSYGIARMEVLPPWLSWKYGVETWERVLYSDIWDRLVLIANTAAFHSQNGDRDMLRLAVRLHDEIYDNGTMETILFEHKKIGDHEYRTAGVVYGQWAREQMNAKNPTSHHDADHRMYRLWSRYISLKPSDQEIRRLVEDKFNPYTGQHMILD